jgi:hypothetical protein
MDAVGLHITDRDLQQVVGKFRRATLVAEHVALSSVDATIARIGVIGDGLNPQHREKLEKAGLAVTGTDENA